MVFHSTALPKVNPQQRAPTAIRPIVPDIMHALRQLSSKGFTTHTLRIKIVATTAFQTATGSTSSRIETQQMYVLGEDPVKHLSTFSKQIIANFANLHQWAK
ncbi:MAG TPA: hypothetical protein VN457_00255, partial [Chlamydiales bacterium]|nr:hypothetical protein [Chlamydiales bacterium]